MKALSLISGIFLCTLLSITLHADGARKESNSALYDFDINEQQTLKLAERTRGAAAEKNYGSATSDHKRKTGKNARKGKLTKNTNSDHKSNSKIAKRSGKMSRKNKLKTSDEKDDATKAIAKNK